MPEAPPPAPNAQAPQNAGSSAEQALIDARRAKATRLRERSENPFANDVVPRTAGSITLDVSRAPRARRVREGRRRQVRRGQGQGSHEGRHVFHLRGRVIAFRSTGGLSFLRLRDRTGEIQLLASEAAMGAAYAALEDIDVGDFIEAEGTLTASKRGELSIEPSRVRILTKALRPPPEKWHGLQDVETRYRQRYVDLVANPPVAEVFRARSHIVRATRKMLDDQGFLEVETPDARAARRRRRRSPLRDAPQRARHAPLHEDRAGALLEAPPRRRPRARLRDRPLLPQRRHLDPAQSRVHDARVLLGVRDVRRTSSTSRR